jgi:hypothetical protein
VEFGSIGIFLEIQLAESEPVPDLSIIDGISATDKALALIFFSAAITLAINMTLAHNAERRVTLEKGFTAILTPYCK